MNDWKSIYQERVTTADEAVKLVKSNQRWLVGHNSSEPQVLMEALCRRADELENVGLWQGLNIGKAEYAKPQYEGHLYVDSVFVGPSTRDAINTQRGHFTPLHLSLINRALQERTVPLDGFFTSVTPPDENGYCNFGVSGDYAMDCRDYCKTIIATVNKRMPWVCSDGDRNLIHVSEIDAFVEIDEPVFAIPKILDSDPITVQIGKNIAVLIEDGATLQMGQGQVPNAILKFLSDKKDLGVHTEVFSDNLIPLIEQGVITGMKKNIDVGKIVSTFVQGTEDLYKYVDHNELIKIMPGHYTNNPAVIAQNDKVVAINSALQVDLTGQICAEAIGTRIISGLGGQLDFLRGASYSKGGKPVIALPSTAKGGTVSRIIATLPFGTPVTTSRNDAFWVVTEYGAVNLFAMPILKRAEALIGIAHPNFRKLLEKDFEAYLQTMH